MRIWLKHLNLAIRTACDQPFVARPAHSLDQVLVRLGLPSFLPACEVPDFDHAVAAATREMLEGLGVLGERVYTVDMARFKVSEEGLRKHALDLCRIEGSCVFACSFERMEIGVEVSSDLCYCRARCLRRGRRPAERFDPHGLMSIPRVGVHLQATRKLFGGSKIEGCMQRLTRRGASAHFPASCKRGPCAHDELVIFWQDDTPNLTIQYPSLTRTTATMKL